MYGVKADEEDAAITDANGKLRAIKKETKKLLLEEQMNRKKIADAKERLAEEKAYLKLK